MDLPDELLRALKVRAAEENLKLREVVADLLRRGLAAAAIEVRPVRNHVQFPLVECVHPAGPAEALTPERVAAILVDGEASDLGTVR